MRLCQHRSYACVVNGSVTETDTASVVCGLLVRIRFAAPEPPVQRIGGAHTEQTTAGTRQHCCDEAHDLQEGHEVGWIFFTCSYNLEPLAGRGHSIG